MAQRSGLTGEMDLLIIRKALDAMPALGAAAAGRSLVMSLNLSAQLLGDALLRGQLLELLGSRAHPRLWRLQVEVVEEGLQDISPDFDSFLSRVSSLGIGIAIDDFGTGYSSLSRLNALPIQMFKIDRCFVHQIGHAFTPSDQLLRTLNTLANSLWGKAAIALEYALTRSGPMSMAPSQLGAFTRSDPARPHPNLEYHVQPLSLDAFGQPLHRFPAITASVCNLNPTSRGQVQIRTPDFAQAPAISPNYLSTAEDRQVAADSLRVTRNIMAQPALAPFQPREFKPGAQYQSDEELARLAGDIASTIFHPVGTTRMGRADDPLAVVDPQLRVRGIRGLRVADAGVMPTITSGNTNAPTLMLAEKAARWILHGG